MSVLTMMSETKNNRREQSTNCIFSSKTSCERATADVDDECGDHIIDHKAGMNGQKKTESNFTLEMREVRERRDRLLEKAKRGVEHSHTTDLTRYEGAGSWQL